MDTDTINDTENTGGKGVASSDMLDLFRRMQNAHYAMAADEWNDNASPSAISRRAAKYDELESEFKSKLNLLLSNTQHERRD